MTLFFAPIEAAAANTTTDGPTLMGRKERRTEKQREREISPYFHSLSLCSALNVSIYSLYTLCMCMNCVLYCSTFLQLIFLFLSFFLSFIVVRRRRPDAWTCYPLAPGQCFVRERCWPVALNVCCVHAFDISLSVIKEYNANECGHGYIYR